MVPENQLHIAEIDFASLYAPAFASTEESAKFYDEISNLPVEKKDARIIIHQAGRMIWLADRIDEVAHGRPAFQVLFYLTAAELVAKIVGRFEGEGRSKKHVQKFFAEICSAEHRERLAKAFQNPGGAYLTTEAAVDLLYGVRCDVVHRGQYYEFSLRQGRFAMLTSLQGIPRRTDITLDELRQIVLEGAVLGARKVMEDGPGHRRAIEHSGMSRQ